MPIHGRKFMVALQAAVLLGAGPLAAGATLAGPLAAGVAAVLSAGTVLKIRKAHAVQKKLKAMAFAVRGDDKGGELAFVATKQIRQTPVQLRIDIGQTPMTRGVNVAGVDLPLTDGRVRLDSALRARLASKGLPPAAVQEIEDGANAAIEVVNALGA